MSSTEKVMKWALSKEDKNANDFGFHTDWCALFIAKALSECGYNLKGTAVYSCTAQMEYWKSKGLWHDGISGIDKNCIVYFDWDMTGDCDHTGLVYDKVDNRLYTIEGNTKGGLWSDTSVNKMIRDVFRYIRGYVKLSDVFDEHGTSIPTPTYYGIGHTTTDNTGKCQLIQHMLNVTNNAGLTEDGIIGCNTRHAILNFQSKHELEVDGIVGDETLFKLVQLYFNIPLENFKIGC